MNRLKLSRYFSTASVRDGHFKTKKHKKRHVPEIRRLIEHIDFLCVMITFANIIVTITKIQILIDAEEKLHNRKVMEIAKAEEVNKG